MSEETTTKKNWFARHRVLTTIGVLFIIGIIASAASGSKPETQTTDSAPAAKTEAKAEPKKPDVPPEYTSALSQANSYANSMHMSKRGVHDQLVSDYGSKFSEAAAQYAIDNVKADWNANALAQAKTYQSQQHMSPAAIRDQLVSDYGEKFTVAEADYAVAHLND